MSNFEGMDCSPHASPARMRCIKIASRIRVLSYASLIARSVGDADGCHGSVHLERWCFDLEAASAAAARLCSCIRCSKSCPRSSFGRFYAPPAAHGRPRWHGWWKFPGLPNICAWSLRRAQNISGEHKVVQNSSAGTFFEWDMYFKYLQSKMELLSLCILYYTINRNLRWIQASSDVGCSESLVFHV